MAVVIVTRLGWGRGLLLLALCTVAAAQEAGATSRALDIYVDAPVGVATEVLDLASIPALAGADSTSTGTCDYRRSRGAFEVTPRGERACVVEVRTEAATIRINVHGVPPVGYGRGTYLPSQPSMPDWRPGRDRRANAYTVTNGSSVPVVLEGIGGHTTLLELGAEIHLLAGSSNPAEGLARWWERAQPFQPTVLQPGQQVTIVITTPRSVLGLKPHLVLSDPASGERWSRPVVAWLITSPLPN